MIRGTHAGYGSGTRRAVATLALFLFALHAVLPAGYMLDTDSLRDGRYEVVICTGAGLQTVVVDKSGNRVAPDGPATPGGEGTLKCPFATVAGKALAVPEQPVLLTIHAVRSVPGLLPPALGLPASADRLPLGSRAPPILLG
ncbi:MAG TPA: DUF2946 domain-containing protein [Rhodospirillaceae bacterium]|nr:DUF2946 domain-containing protein [Rhodospirillaceae bacterium]HCS69813.1 DUF2946 domain-containing protein [Rhodospirillaceae bacterium]|tara:strand:+ start:621 stop:1046 length:426 start_codon:yes stop_codon:yes gene_type:complete